MLKFNLKDACETASKVIKVAQEVVKVAQSVSDSLSEIKRVAESKNRE